MRLNTIRSSLPALRVALLAVIFASASFALADQKIKTKSNIKNDRLAETPSSAASADQSVAADTKAESKTVASQSSSSSAPIKAVDKP